MMKWIVSAAMAAAFAAPNMASAQSLRGVQDVKIPVVTIPANVTGKWVLDPKLCPDIREDVADARVARSRRDLREDRRDQRIINCPPSSYKFVVDPKQAPDQAILLRRDGTTEFISRAQAKAIEEGRLRPRRGLRPDRGVRAQRGARPLPLPEPRTTYTAPNATVPTYTQPTYNPPAQTYGNPAPTYGNRAPTLQPAPTYGNQVPTYQPAPTYGNPTPTYVEPQPSYGSTVPVQGTTYGNTTFGQSAPAIAPAVPAYTQPAPAPIYESTPVPLGTTDSGAGQWVYENGQWVRR